MPTSTQELQKEAMAETQIAINGGNVLGKRTRQDENTSGAADSFQKENIAPTKDYDLNVSPLGIKGIFESSVLKLFLCHGSVDY